MTSVGMPPSVPPAEPVGPLVVVVGSVAPHTWIAAGPPVIVSFAPSTSLGSGGGGGPPLAAGARAAPALEGEGAGGPVVPPDGPGAVPPPGGGGGGRAVDPGGPGAGRGGR